MATERHDPTGPATEELEPGQLFQTLSEARVLPQNSIRLQMESSKREGLAYGPLTLTTGRVYSGLHCRTLPKQHCGSGY